jgi:hypothetical protein
MSFSAAPQVVCSIATPLTLPPAIVDPAGAL